MRTPLAGLVTVVSCLILSLLICPGCRRSQDAATAPPVIKTSSGLEMVVIPAGWFEMGSAKGAPDEAPPHRVWVDAFLLDKYEVGQEHYAKLVGKNPASFKGPGRPVDTVTWTDAVVYCNLRSRAEGLEPCYQEEGGTWQCNFQANGYRLPTEAEWEYACRAGTERERYFGSDVRTLKEHAWYTDTSGRQTHVVGQKKPNPWGLYDMYGNVAEWCNDVYAENYYKTSPAQNPRGPEKGEIKVLRGGGWQDGADTLRSSWRSGENCGFVDACVMDSAGFRCVKKAP